MAFFDKMLDLAQPYWNWMMLHSARWPVNELNAKKKSKFGPNSRQKKKRSPGLILLPMPPFAKRLAALLAIKLEDENAVQF